MLRPLKGIELHFANKAYHENILMAIKFSHPKYVPMAIENFKKIFCGFRLKIVDNHYCRKDSNEITVHQIPGWIQDCQFANSWVFRNHTIPITEGLTTIACNDSIVVVNSSHNLNDGGFMVKALNQCIDDLSNEKVYSDPPLYSSDAFKDDFEEATRKFDKKLIHPMNKLTKCQYDTNDPHLAPPGTHYIDHNDIIHSSALSCYDEKTKRPKSLSEMSWTAIGMSIAALNFINNRIPYDYRDPLSLTVVLDARRFAFDKSRINWQFGNCVAQPSIKADVTKNDTIQDVCKKFRQYINILNPYGALYSAGHMHELLSTPPKVIFGCDSSIGPIKFKRPILDFDITDQAKMTLGTGDHGEKHGSQFTIISYSKINEDRNDFCYFSRFFPASMSFENAGALIASYRYFMTKIPLNARFDDAMNELIRFQNSIKKKFK